MELCASIGVKKAGYEKKIKKENVESDFLPWSRTSARGTTVKHKGEHLARLSGAQWHARASVTSCQ